jgi:hypothetical protein
MNLLYALMSGCRVDQMGEKALGEALQVSTKCGITERGWKSDLAMAKISHARVEKSQASR